MAPYVNHACYAKGKGACSSQMSAEHPIPLSVLQSFVDGKQVVVSGVQWADEEKLVGLASLTARVLCRDHNSALSNLDTELAKLQRAVEEAESQVRGDSSFETVAIDGGLIERALTKVALGTLSGGWLGNRAAGTRITEFSGLPTARVVDLMLGRRRFGPRQGLYLDVPRGAVGAPSNFWLHPISRDDGLAALGVGIRHVLFWLCLTGAPARAQRHPSALDFKRDGADRGRISLRWSADARPTGSVELIRAGQVNGWVDYPPSSLSDWTAHDASATDLGGSRTPDGG